MIGLMVVCEPRRLTCATADSDAVMKNPFHTPEMPINSSLFDTTAAEPHHHCECLMFLEWHPFLSRARSEGEEESLVVSPLTRPAIRTYGIPSMNHSQLDGLQELHSHAYEIVLMCL